MFTKEALLTANIETLQNNLIHESTRNDFRSKLTLGLCEIQGIGITQNIPAGSQKIFDVLFAGKEYSHNILRLLKNLDQDILKKLFDYYHVKKIESIQDRLVLACLYMNAIGVQNNEKEIERAFDLLTLAANNNNAPAQNMLGELLQKTRDVSEKITGSK
jgi:TPR repeat protein